MRHCLYHLSNSSLSYWSIDRWVWTISELSVLLSFPYEYLIRYITYDMLVKVFTLVALVYVYSVPELLSQKLLYTINSTKLLSFNKNHSYKNFFNNCVNTPKEYLKYIICKHIYTFQIGLILCCWLWQNMMLHTWEIPQITAPELHQALLDLHWHHAMVRWDPKLAFFCYVYKKKSGTCMLVWILELMYVICDCL